VEPTQDRGWRNETDAHYLSRIFRCEPEFIASKTRGAFACFVRRQMHEAIELRVPADALESMPRMTETEYRQIRTALRDRYAVPAAPSHHQAGRDPQPQPSSTPQPANDPTPQNQTKPASPKSRQPRAKRINPDASERTEAIGDWEP